MAGFIIFRDGARAYFARKSCIPIHHIFFSYGFVCLYDGGDGVATGSVNMHDGLCVNVVFRVQTSFVKRIYIFSWVRADYTLVPQWSKSTTNYKYRTILFQICSVTSKVDGSTVHQIFWQCLYYLICKKKSYKKVNKPSGKNSKIQILNYNLY